MNDTDLSIIVRRRIEAPAEKLFNAWLDPRMLARFMTPGEGMSVPRAETDPREGGRYTIIMATPEREIPHSGTYKEITPHSRIVFTWESPFSDPDSTVALDFDEKDGATEVTLTHVKFRSEQMAKNHEGGWTAILAELEKTLACRTWRRAALSPRAVPSHRPRSSSPASVR